MREQVTVSYCWSADGDPEQCSIRGAWLNNVECTHCLKTILHAGLILTAPDGDVYHLHSLCALKGCAGFDQPTIYNALRTIGAAPLGEHVRVVKHDSLFVSEDRERQWRQKGEPEEDWYVEIDSHGKELAGDWEYDYDTGYITCAFGSPHKEQARYECSMR